MRALVVYESLFGNTHHVAEAIGKGFGEADVVVVPVTEVTAEQSAEADLLVVGGPTHVHGLSSPRTREGAVDQETRSAGDLHLETDVHLPGIREWLDRLEPGAGRRAAAFDTRVDVSPLISGRASKGIAKRLRSHGFVIVGEPESFLVDKETHLLAGELERAEHWGADLLTQVD
jgi:hypothetical protein